MDSSLNKKKQYQISLIREEVKRYVDVLKRTIEVFLFLFLFLFYYF